MTLLVKTEQSVGEARVTVGVNEDDVQAGYNDTTTSTNAAGGFISFPATASMGSLKWFATSSSGNYAITCTNASFGQATAITLQDPGAAAANFTLDTGVVSAGVGDDSRAAARLMEQHIEAVERNNSRTDAATLLDVDCIDVFYGKAQALERVDLRVVRRRLR